MKPLIPNNYKSKDKNKILNSIHICILGDSNSDLYDKSLYRKLKSLLNSLSILFKWGKLHKDRIIIYLGRNFYLDKLFVE